MSTDTAATSHENRLARETSPYLLQHKHNPVDWWPWGTEALAEAKRANKPILLSVGYAACHWCHVMAHESFEDAATAQAMNDLFVENPPSSISCARSSASSARTRKAWSRTAAR